MVGRRPRRAERGEVRYLILDAIRDEPRHGYDIMQTLENKTNGAYRPSPGTSWQIQLTGRLDTSVDADIFDIDLFETSPADIAALHASGRKVICYFDTAYESYRPDSAQLAPYRGNPIEGWPGQYWLDIREPAVVDVMLARIALA